MADQINQVTCALLPGLQVCGDLQVGVLVDVFCAFGCGLSSDFAQGIDVGDTCINGALIDKGEHGKQLVVVAGGGAPLVEKLP